MANNFLELNGKVVDRFICEMNLKISVAKKQYKYYLNKLSRDLGSARGNSKCQWCQKTNRPLKSLHSEDWRFIFAMK